MHSQRVILVTGGNRGIGLAIVDSLVKCLSDSIILMGCRNPDDGHRAAESLATTGTNSVEPLQIDVTLDESIRQAVSRISEKYQRLDVLINNAGFASISTQNDFSDLRGTFQEILNVNVSSVAIVTNMLLPLLRQSPIGGKVIQIGSARGSITRLANGELPPAVSIPYAISKTALNALTLQMAILPDNQRVEFQIATPGHCKTAFNGYRGTREPSEGANVVIELVVGERKPTKSWETLSASRELVEVPW